MSTSAPIDPQIPVTPAPAAPSFEESLRKFWEKNAKTILLLCALILLAVIGKGAFEYLQAQKENGIAEEYAQASTNDKLKSFAGGHPEHILGATAHLRLADDAFVAGKFADASASYQKAASFFKTGPFASRAALGAAVAEIAGGQTAKGEEQLKRLADDSSHLKATRAEAAYHLGTLYAENGRTDEATKYLDQVTTLDPASAWAQRAAFRRTALPATAPAPALVVPPAKP